MTKVPIQEVSTINSKAMEFTADEQKIIELKKSSAIEDQLTVILMEAHEEESELDCTGLWYSFARPKALAIMKRFNVTEKDASS